jgi:hypothetical protein
MINPALSTDAVSQKKTSAIDWPQLESSVNNALWGQFATLRTAQSGHCAADMTLSPINSRRQFGMRDDDAGDYITVLLGCWN